MIVKKIISSKKSYQTEWFYSRPPLICEHPWIKLLYTLPRASVTTNGKRSKYFQLLRGTRQGCPISPLLFALALEPLSLTLQISPAIDGIYRRGREHRLSLYADDLLLYVSDPVSCYPVNDLALQIKDGILPFKLARNGFKYRGINITRDMQSLYQENFCLLFEKVKLDLKKWKPLHLSLAGKVNCIKMNVLPKFLYLFQCIPLYLPKSFFFKSIDKALIAFIWDGKKPRIRLELLQRPKIQGGSALPNFCHYYWASNVQKNHVLAPTLLM